GFYRIAHLEMLGDVFDAFLGDVVGAQVALDAFADIDGDAACIDFLDRAGEDAAARMVGHVLAERILLQLLDAQRNALALRIDRQHDGFDVVAFLDVAHEIFAGCRPGNVGQMDETVDTAFEADEDAEIGDRLDLAGDLVVLLVDGGKRFPRVGAGLLDAERDATTLFIDVENHDFDIVADL